jgi:purine-binding chemotaxis protein CheW
MTVSDVTRPATGVSQYLTFRLDGEEYGLEILRVQEIKACSKIIRLPNVPPEIKGVMNLRGSVVPVVDLRIRFGLVDAPQTKFSVIIVATVGTKVVGFLVDAVSDVLNVSDIDAAPDFGPGVDTAFLTGIAKAGNRLIYLLNIDRLVDHTDDPTLIA